MYDNAKTPRPELCGQTVTEKGQIEQGIGKLENVAADIEILINRIFGVIEASKTTDGKQLQRPPMCEGITVASKLFRCSERLCEQKERLDAILNVLQSQLGEEKLI